MRWNADLGAGGIPFELALRGRACDPCRAVERIAVDAPGELIAHGRSVVAHGKTDLFTAQARIFDRPALAARAHGAGDALEVLRDVQLESRALIRLRELPVPFAGRVAR